MMDIEFKSFKNQGELIAGVALHQLTIHRDKRGSLMETLREDWPEVFHRPQLQFGQSYFSVTQPGFARDEDKWHVHPTKQTDRFIVLAGHAVVALYDWRKDSKTYGMLNLFSMGEGNGDENQYLLLIPINVLHAFCTIGDMPCELLSFPDHTYDTTEEGRIPLEQAAVTFSDGSAFSWSTIREQFKKNKEIA